MTPTTTPVITTQGLTKSYRHGPVVDGLDLYVPAGRVYGFLGPNGAGKSTTMKMLLSLVQPSSGDITVLGRPMNRHSRTALLPRIGSLIEAPAGYGHLTGAENMRITQKMLGLRRDQIERAVATVRMGDQMGKLVRDYSFGMKQRLGIAMALAREPQLLILDEPTNGLDPAGIEETRTLITHLAGTGMSVMVSSHLLDEIDKVAEVYGILNRGRLVFQGTREELFTRSTPDALVDTIEPEHAREAARAFRPQPVPGGLRVANLTDSQLSDLVFCLASAGVPVHGVRRHLHTLEDVFMDLTGRGDV